MKVPYSWLAEWVKVPWQAPELGSRLTMAGIELEALASAAPPFSGVVVAQIVSAEPHPQADKLQVCRVSTGSGATLQIVCGAGNARAGLKAALAGTKVSGPAIGGAPAGHAERLAVSLEAPAACPRFAGCILRGVNNRAEAPLWMRERLRRAGVRAISPVVDVTNYVMLELGQPMHAYDLKKLRGGIRVRRAHAAELVTLLDGQAINAP